MQIRLSSLFVPFQSSPCSPRPAPPSALAGVASSNQVLRSFPSPGHSASPPAAGARKKRKGGKGGGEKKDGHWPAWSLSVPSLEPARPQNICRRSNSPLQALRLPQGGGKGVLRTKSPGTRWIFFFLPPSSLDQETKQQKYKNTKEAKSEGRDSFSLQKIPNSASRWGAYQSGSLGGGRRGSLHTKGRTFEAFFLFVFCFFAITTTSTTTIKRSPVSLGFTASPEGMGDGSVGPQTPRAPLLRPRH